MGEKSREVEERERREREKLSSPLCCVCVVFFSLAAFQSSEGRPCWVEHNASLSFKSHSLSQFPLRISQRDQQRRVIEKRRKMERKETGGRHVKNRREREEEELGGWVGEI